MSEWGTANELLDEVEKEKDLPVEVRYGRRSAICPTNKQHRVSLSGTMRVYVYVESGEIVEIRAPIESHCFDGDVWCLDCDKDYYVNVSNLESWGSHESTEWTIWEFD